MSLNEISDKWDCRIEYLLSLDATYLYKVGGKNVNGYLTPAEWKKILLILEELGYVWQGSGEKPTTQKYPSNYLNRKIHIKKDKTIAYGQGSYAPGFNIKFEEFNKLLDLGKPLEDKNLDDFIIEKGVLKLK